MNSVALVGRLTKDPETRYADSGSAVSRFTLAVDRHDKEKTADFINITAFGRTAELCEKYLVKGKQIGVQGKIQTGSYKNKNGDTVYTTSVVADRIEFLGTKAADKEEPQFVATTEEIPF